MSNYTANYTPANPGTDYPVKNTNMLAQLTLDSDKVDYAGLGYQFGYRRNATAGLTAGYYGGVLNVAGTPTLIADGTIALTASATNYVEHDSAGTVTKNTSGFTAGRFPMFTATTSDAAITAVAEKRTALRSNDRLHFDGTTLTAHTLTVSTGTLTCAALSASGAATIAGGRVSNSSGNGDFRYQVGTDVNRSYGGTFVTLANNAVASYGQSFRRGFVIVETSEQHTALFAISGGAISEVSDPSGVFSISAGTASSTNVYLNGSSLVEVENKRGTSVTYGIFLLGSFGF